MICRLQELSTGGLGNELRVRIGPVLVLARSNGPLC